MGIRASVCVCVCVCVEREVSGWSMCVCVCVCVEGGVSVWKGVWGEWCEWVVR